MSTDMTPNELRAYVNSPGGWGQVGNSREHERYMLPAGDAPRRKCHCGCGRKSTHVGWVNGLAMTGGCELYVRRWVKDGGASEVQRSRERYAESRCRAVIQSGKNKGRICGNDAKLTAVDQQEPAVVCFGHAADGRHFTKFKHP